MADSSIRLEIRGDSGDLQRAAAAAAAAIKGLDVVVKQSGGTVRSHTRDNDRFSRSLLGLEGVANKVNRAMTLLRNVLALAKFPALIAGVGLLTKLVGALSAGVLGLSGSLAPLAGLLVGFPALLGAMGQGMLVWKLGMGEVTKALGGNQAALKRLTTQQRGFYDQIQTLKPQLAELKDAAGENLFEGVNAGLKLALRNFPALEGVVKKTSKVMGGLAAQAGKLLGSKGFGKDFERIGAQNATTLRRMGEAGLHLFSALRHVLVAARPFIDWLTKGALHFATWTEHAAKAGRESGRLARFFDSTKHALQLLWPFLRDSFIALGNITKAAKPLGDSILRALAKAAAGWREWTGSVEGQNSLKRYFDDAKPAIFEMGLLVRDLVKGLVKLSDPQGTGKFVKQLRTEVLPALLELVAGATKAFGPHIMDLIVSLAKTLSLLVGPTGALTILVDLLRIASDALRTLLSVPGLGGFATSMITVAAVWKGLKWAGMVGAAQKLSTLWKGIAVSAAATGAATVGGAAAGGAGAAGAGVAAKSGAAGALAASGPVIKAAAVAVVATTIAERMLVKRQGKRGGPLWNPVGPLGAGGPLGAAGGTGRGSLLGGGRPAGSYLKFGDLAKQVRSGELGIEGLNKLLRVFSTTEMPAAQRQTLRLMARLRSLAGVKASLRDLAPSATTAGIKRLQSHFLRLGNVGYSSITKLRSVLQRGVRLIGEEFARGSKGWRGAMSRNTREGIKSVKLSMEAGLISTRKGTTEILHLVRENYGRSKEITMRDFGQARDAIKAAVRAGVISAREGTREINRLMRRQLASVGLTVEQSIAIEKAAKGPRRTGPGDPLIPHKARGGLVQYGRAGEAGPDTIATRIGGQDVAVGAGETAAVLTRHQRAELNARTADVGGLQGFFRRFNRPHSAAGFARGGMVRVPGDPDTTSGRDRVNAAIVNQVASFIKRFGIQIGYAYDPGGGHQSPGHNVTGTALDIHPYTTGWDGVDRAVAAAVKAGKTVYYDGRFGSTNLPPHGRGHHAHIEWGMGGAVAGGGAAAAETLKRLRVKGAPSPLKGLVKRTLDLEVAGANKLIEQANASTGVGSGRHGGEVGADLHGSGAAANQRLGRQLAERYGWGSGAQWAALRELWTRESGWNNMARNPSSGAFGIPQGLPPSKMGAAAASGDAAAQIRWGLSYIKGRYGSPAAALAFHDAHNWYQRGGLVGMLGDSLGVGSAPLRAARGRLLSDWQQREAVWRGGRRRYRRRRKGRPGDFERVPRGSAGGGKPTPTLEGLDKFIEDETARFSEDERRARFDDVLTPAELNKLLGRLVAIRNAYGSEIGLVKGTLLPMARAGLRKWQRRVTALTRRVRVLLARVKRNSEALKRLSRKKKLSSADKRQRRRLAQSIRRDRRELVKLTGADSPRLSGLATLTEGSLGRANAQVSGPDSFSESVATNLDLLRDSQLPARFKDAAFAVDELRKEGATKPEGFDSQLADVLREQLAQARRALAVSEAQFKVFRGFLPFVGKFVHGGRLPATGLYLGHRGETVVPAPDGPYPPVNRARAAPPQVTVIVKGDAAPLLQGIEVMVDGRIARHKQVVERRARMFAVAPGRR